MFVLLLRNVSKSTKMTQQQAKLHNSPFLRVQSDGQERFSKHDNILNDDEENYDSWRRL